MYYNMIEGNFHILFLIAHYMGADVLQMSQRLRSKI